MGTIKIIFKKYKEVLMYLIFGILTTLVSLISYYVLTFTILNPKNSVYLQIANILSWVISVIFAYFTNRKYVFNSKTSNHVKEFIGFVGGRVTTLILDIIIMFLFVTLLKFNDKIIKLISQVAVIILNYVISKFLIFNKTNGGVS